MSLNAYVGGFAVGTEGVPATLLRDPPIPTVTAPTGTVTTSTITVTWTYLSNIGRTQKAYRVVLFIVGVGVVFDTGTIASAATSHILAYTLSPFTNYRVGVGVSDGIDGGQDPILLSPGWAYSDIYTEFSEVAVYPDNMQVGSIYEIAINGVGYMLQDSADAPLKRTTAQIQPQRFSTGDTPFSESIDRYSIVGYSDFTSGEGQTYLNRPTSDSSRYFYSEGINPFIPGELSLIAQPTQQIASTTVPGTEFATAVMAGGVAYKATSTTQLTSMATPGGSTTAFSTGLAGAMTGLASDGVFWYATDGATIRRNSSAANPGANWSTDDATEIAWCTDRLAGLDTAAASPNFTTYTTAGLEENTGGWQSFTGANLRGLTGGDGYIWFGVNYSTSGHVRGWQVGSGVGATFVAFTLPEGETVDSLYFYLGNVFCAARTTTTPFNRRIYRCVASEGLLTPQLLCEINANGIAPWRTAFAGLGKYVAFTWQTMRRDTISGIGVVDLESGGYARWQAVGGTTGTAGRPVSAVIAWGGTYGFGIDVISSSSDGGLYGSASGTSLATGFLETSVGDLNSTIIKAIDLVSVTTKPLAGSVDLYYSTNTDQSFVFLGSMTSSGGTTRNFSTIVFGASIGLKAVLSPSGATGPVVKVLEAKTHPKGISDQVVVYPVNCGDRVDGLNGVEIIGAGTGIDRVRTLESLVSQTVKLQDIDWRQTRQSYLFQIMSVEVELIGEYDRNKGYRTDHGVATVTMRRPVS